MIISQLTNELIRELALLTNKDRRAVCRAFLASVVKTDEGEHVIELLLVEKALKLPAGYILNALGLEK